MIEFDIAVCSKFRLLYRCVDNNLNVAWEQTHEGLDFEVFTPCRQAAVRLKKGKVQLARALPTQPELPDGDLLLHAGDLTQSGSFEELQMQIDWLHSQPRKFKVVIAGNHDLCLDPSKRPGNDGKSARLVDWRL